MQFIKPILLYILVCLSVNVFGQWNDHNTGINDHLTGVVFYGNNGVVVGHTGIYYTTSGGIGPASWTEFHITGNSADSLVLSNTQFQHCFSDDIHTDYVFAVGRDTIADKAIVFQFHIPTQAYMFLYQGTVGSSLVNLDYSDESNQYFAVGPNGLIVKFNLSTFGVVEPSGHTVDFESISFYNDRLSIGANGLRIYGTDDNPGITLNVQAEAGTNFKDVWRVSGNIAYATGDDLYFLNYFLGTTGPNSKFNFGPLNAEAVWFHNGDYFLATDHGVFVHGFSGAVEWQPSSLNLHFQDFWSENSSSLLYAVGENGTLMSTNNNGDTPLPYLSIDEEGVCTGGFLNADGYFGASASCEWYLDGVLVSGTCNDYSSFFNTAGYYELKLIGINATGSDSAIVNFYVVDTPQINLPTVLDDVLLCKEETIDIDIDNSENNVFYELFEVTSGLSFGASPSGNGGTISYTTDLITDAGDYFMVATSTLADCSDEFTDTIFIDVEETKAAYHVGISNAIPGETVYFYENCIDADNYEWNFSPSASIAQSNLADPTNDFSSAGNQAVELICWSNDLCYDTIQGPGPTIYLEPAIYDSCWVNQNNGSDPIWQGQYHSTIQELTEVTGGYITCGTYHNMSFATNYGDSLQLDNYGAHMSKYDDNGVYKWSIHGIGAGNGVIGSGNNYNQFAFKSVDEDSQGNIITVGYLEDYFVDNGGDTNNLPVGFGQIIKLDPLGNIIWSRSVEWMFPLDVVVDHSDNIILTSQRSDQGNGFILFDDSTQVDTIDPSGVIHNYGITKILSNGDLAWDIPFFNNWTNPSLVMNPQVDDSNNVYLGSVVEHGGNIYDIGNPGGITVPIYGGGHESILVKFDSAGYYQWMTHTNTDGVINDDTRFWDIQTDDNGNTYVSGENDVNVVGFGLEHRVYSKDGSYIGMEAGQYFVAKYDRNGMAKWVKGANTSYYGYGYEIDVKDSMVYVLGQVKENGPSWDTVQFYNPDSSYINLGISQSDYFIAAYDTSGTIKWVTKNSNGFVWLSDWGWHGFYKDVDNDKFYAARSGHLNPGTNYPDFGDVIVPTNGTESWVTKMCAECGIMQTPSFQSSFDTTICLGSSYTFPGGNTVNNISSNMSDTLLMSSINAVDSLVITNLWVNGYTEIDSVDICEFEPYTFPDGTTIDSVSTSLTHVSSFQTTFGCDSLITTELTMIPAYHLIDTVSHCPSQGYIFPDFTIIGGITGVYSHTSTFLFGQCDSSITTVLVPYPGFLTTDSVTVCNGDDYTFPDGTIQTNITVPTTYQSVFNVGGCDSTITTVINIAGLAPFTDSDTICSGEDYTFHDGTTVTNITSVTAYSSSFTDINGCDSTIQTTIYPTTTTYSVTQQDTLLTADQAPGSGITYQWIDCDNGNALIPGENGQSYIATANGSYAVIIDNNGCIDTSSCLIVSGIGWESNQVNGFEIFPNPTTDYINIEFDSKFDFSHFILTNTLGQIIGSYSIDDAIMKVELPLADGVYFIHVFSTKGLQGTVKVIKN